MVDSSHFLLVLLILLKNPPFMLSLVEAFRGLFQQNLFFTGC